MPLRSSICIAAGRQLFLLFCVIAFAGLPAVSSNANPAQDSGSETISFGKRLVAAARDQLSFLVIYDPSYRKLDYPMGDVPSYIGVCTDVVVRAYRQLGIDLQPLVHRSGLGSGDRNIDHRRVNVLGRFFKRYGKSLPISDDGKDYKPGDLVTYHVPDGRYSKTHIAIVSDRTSPDGVPLVIHNRGYGVREEDWLFGSRITGHFRYRREPNIEGWKTEEPD